MRFLVLSDTHGDRTRMTRALDYLAALKPDALLHLGDCTRDGEFLARELRLPLHAVCGNCDAFSSLYPSEEVLEVEGARLFLTHGHRYGVKEDLLRLTYAAKERGCGAALFGHTHVPLLQREEGILLLNPGSLCRPLFAGEGGLALCKVEKGGVSATLLPYILRP